MFNILVRSDMVKRFVDKRRGNFEIGRYGQRDADVCVVCPKCQKMGIVKDEGEQCSFFVIVPVSDYFLEIFKVINF